MTPLLVLGKKRPLQADDVWQLEPKYQTHNVSARFETVWKSEMGRPKPALLRALRKAFGAQFILAGIPLALQSAAQYVPPLLLRRLIEYVGDDDDDREWFGYALAGGMFVALMVATSCENQYFDKVVKTGVYLRSGLIGSVYVSTPPLWRLVWGSFLLLSFLGG